MMLLRSRDRLGDKAKIWTAARKAETHYSRQLRKIARHIGDIVRGFPLGDLDALPDLQATMVRYSALLEPWARSVAGRMIADVAKRDEQAWFAASRALSAGLRKEIRDAPTGAVLRGLQADQVRLITSLPTEAAQRVQKLTLEGLTTGARADEISAEIMRTGEVTKARANLIARTETSRVASNLTQARAQYIGSVAYVWRTASDSDVRPSHKKMAGRTVDWTKPPTLDGMTGHAGCLPNCRCYAEPVIPD